MTPTPEQILEVVNTIVKEQFINPTKMDYLIVQHAVIAGINLQLQLELQEMREQRENQVVSEFLGVVNSFIQRKY